MFLLNFWKFRQRISLLWQANLEYFLSLQKYNLLTISLKNFFPNILNA
jgi:hypothetical protein